MTKKIKCNAWELLAIIGIEINTISILIIQNTVSYEKISIYEKIPKSNYMTIIHNNPIFAIAYLLCLILLLIGGIYGLALLRKTKED